MTWTEWVEPNLTQGEAIAAGLFVAEWSLRGEFVRAYGRTEGEAVVNVIRKRDRAGTLSVASADGWHQLVEPL